MLAGPKRQQRIGMADLRRRAERDGIEFDAGIQHLRERAEVRQALHGGMAAGARHDGDAVGLGDGGNVLVAGDLADAHDPEANVRHVR